MPPFVPNIISLNESNIYGTHFVATIDIEAGQELIVTAPFASVGYIKPHKFGCIGCGKSSAKKIYCDHCFGVWFCSQKCEKSRYHRSRCDTSFKRSDCEDVRLATKIISVAFDAADNVEAFAKFLVDLLFCKTSTTNHRTCKPPYSTYGEMLKLVSNSQHPTDEQIAKVKRVVSYAENLPQIKSLQMQHKKKLLFELALRHILSFPIYTFGEEIPYQNGICYSRYYIYDLFSRFNHSCDPNVDHYVDDNEETHLFASRPIKAGEQLFITYITGLNFDSSKGRTRYLKETWNFDCTCKLCSSKRPR